MKYNRFYGLIDFFYINHLSFIYSDKKSIKLSYVFKRNVPIQGLSVQGLSLSRVCPVQCLSVLRLSHPMFVRPGFVHPTFVLVPMFICKKIKDKKKVDEWMDGRMNSRTA